MRKHTISALLITAIFINCEVLAQDVKPTSQAHLIISQWTLAGKTETPPKIGERVHMRRTFSWKEGQSVIRECWQHQYGPMGYHGQVEEATHVILDIDCDFITYAENGWQLMDKRYRNRSAFLRSQSRWVTPKGDVGR